VSFKLFSVDDHIIEPAHVWSDRLPARFQEAGPHVIEQDGREYWVYEGRRLETMGLNAVAGKPSDQWGMEPVRFSDMHQGCYDPVARVNDMRDEGIIASVPFPTLPGFGGRVFHEFADKELADLCVKAYNDFMIDEWCAACPEFYVPTIIVQLWDVELAAAEVRRCAERGARTVALPDNPHPMGLPSIHSEWWDPLWRALEETETVVSLHIGASGRVPMASPDTHFSTAIASGPAQAGMEMVADLLFSRVVHQFPGLKFVITEGGIGYMPYLLERIDDVWEKNRAWDAISSYDRPTENFRRAFWVCAVNESFGLEQRHRIGVDKILWECDYPHAETPWPNSQREAEKQFAGMPSDEVALMTHLNAQALFRFPGASW